MAPTCQKIERLILGTVQLGLDYGINNQSGKPDLEVAQEILTTAKSLGINKIDTADGYGESQSIIGHVQKELSFDILSKFSLAENNFNLKSRLSSTLDILKTNRLYGYSFHSFDNYKSFQISDQIKEIKALGLVEYFGVSIYNNQEFQKAIDSEELDIIQIPFNLLDNYSSRGKLIENAIQQNKIIHVRSIFLQGLFFMDTDKLPVKIRPLKKYLKIINEIAKDNKISINELALLYPLSCKKISGVLFGVESVDQLLKNINCIKDAELGQDIIRDINNILVTENDLLNPGNWK